MKTRMDEDPFAKNVQGIGAIYHEVSLLMTFLQTEPEVKDLNITYCCFYYTVIENRDD